MKERYKIELAKGEIVYRSIPTVEENEIIYKNEPRVKELIGLGDKLTADIFVIEENSYQLLVQADGFGQILSPAQPDFYEALYHIIIELEKLGWLMLCHCGRMDAHVTKHARGKQNGRYLGIIELGDIDDLEDKIVEYSVLAFDPYVGKMIRGDWARQRHCQHSPRHLFDIDKYYF